MTLNAQPHHLAPPSRYEKKIIDHAELVQRSKDRFTIPSKDLGEFVDAIASGTPITGNVKTGVATLHLGNLDSPIVAVTTHSGHVIPDRFQPLLSRELVHANGSYPALDAEADTGTDLIAEIFPNHLRVNILRVVDVNRPQENALFDVPLGVSEETGKERRIPYWNVGKVWQEDLKPEAINELHEMHRQYFRSLEAVITAMVRRHGYVVVPLIHSYSDKRFKGLNYPTASPVLLPSKNQLIQDFQHTVSESLARSFQSANLAWEVRPNFVFIPPGFTDEFLYHLSQRLKIKFGLSYEPIFQYLVEFNKRRYMDEDTIAVDRDRATVLAQHLREAITQGENLLKKELRPRTGKIRVLDTPLRPPHGIVLNTSVIPKSTGKREFNFPMLENGFHTTQGLSSFHAQGIASTPEEVQRTLSLLEELATGEQEGRYAARYRMYVPMYRIDYSIPTENRSEIFLVPSREGEKQQQIMTLLRAAQGNGLIELVEMNGRKDYGQLANTLGLEEFLVFLTLAQTDQILLTSESPEDDYTFTGRISTVAIAASKTQEERLGMIEAELEELGLFRGPRQQDDFVIPQDHGGEMRVLYAGGHIGTCIKSSLAALEALAAKGLQETHAELYLPLDLLTAASTSVDPEEQNRLKERFARGERLRFDDAPPSSYTEYLDHKIINYRIYLDGELLLRRTNNPAVPQTAVFRWFSKYSEALAHISTVRLQDALRRQEAQQHALALLKPQSLRDSSGRPTVVFPADKEAGKEALTFEENPPIVRTFDPKTSQIALVVSEDGFDASGRGRIRFDRVDNGIYVDGELVPWSKLGGAETGIRTIPELLATFAAAHPTKEVLAVLPNSNLGFNDWFLGVVRGQLFHYQEERLERDYDMLVMPYEGPPRVRTLRFVNDRGQRGIFDLEDPGVDVSDRIEYAIYGQHIVKDGRPNLEAVYDQFDDLRHLFRFPLFQIGFRQVHHGFSDGRGDLYRNRDLVKSSLRGEALELSLAPLNALGITPETREYEFARWGYKNTTGIKGAADLDIGDYLVSSEGKILTIKLLPGTHPHSLFGLTRDGELLTALVPGTTHYRGAVLNNLAEQLAERGAQDVFLWANGKDALMQIGGEATVEAEGSRNQYLEVALITRDREQPLPPGLPKDGGARQDEESMIVHLGDRTSTVRAYWNGLHEEGPASSEVLEPLRRIGVTPVLVDDVKETRRLVNSLSTPSTELFERRSRAQGSVETSL